MAYLPDNRWRDYGGNRTQPGGDAFEAYALVTYGHGWRDRALADVCRQMTAMAWHELEAAARSDRGVPGWVAEIMAPIGWRRYERLRASESAVRRSRVRKLPDLCTIWNGRQAVSTREKIEFWRRDRNNPPRVRRVVDGYALLRRLNG